MKKLIRKKTENPNGQATENDVSDSDIGIDCHCCVSDSPGEK